MKKDLIKTVGLFLLGPLSLLAFTSFAQAEELLHKRQIDQIGITTHNNIIFLTKTGEQFKATPKHCPVITDPANLYFHGKAIKSDIKVVVYQDRKPRTCKLDKVVKLAG